MDKNTIISPFDKIRLLIGDNELMQAINMLLDSSFSLDNSHKSVNEIISLKRRFKQLKDESRSVGETEDSRSKINILTKNMLDLTDIIEEKSRLMEAEGTFATDRNVSNKNNSQNVQMNTIELSQKTQLERDMDQFNRDSNNTNFDNSISFAQIKKAYTNRVDRKHDFLLDFNTTFKLSPNEITAVVGPNGSGKTTLLRIVAGDLSFDEGVLEYNFVDCHKQKWISKRSQIAYVKQRPPKWYGSVEENLHFTASQHGIKGKENCFLVDFFINRLDLEAYRNSYWHELSGGFLVRFELANALIWKPKLLVLDEPLASLDIKTQYDFLRDLNDISSSPKFSFPILLSSQNIYELESVVDQIIFLDNGRLIYSDILENFDRNAEDSTFLISCNLDLAQVRERLEKLEINWFRNMGSSFIICVPKGITVIRILETITVDDSDIIYIRNITNSVSKLFLTSE